MPWIRIIGRHLPMQCEKHFSLPFLLRLVYLELNANQTERGIIMAKYTLMKTEGRAKRAQFETVHGTIQTPVFMNVGTIGAIKGAVSTQDLYDIGTQVELSNTYHLHVRPGDKVVKQLGGLHKFMNWERPILTDSGGFQVFSLAKLRKIKEEGVHFQSHIDGHKIFMGPEESMQIQSNLWATGVWKDVRCI